MTIETILAVILEQKSSLPLFDSVDGIIASQDLTDAEKCADADNNSGKKKNLSDYENEFFSRLQKEYYSHEISDELTHEVYAYCLNTPSVSGKDIIFIKSLTKVARTIYDNKLDYSKDFHQIIYKYHCEGIDMIKKISETSKITKNLKRISSHLHFHAAHFANEFNNDKRGEDETEASSKKRMGLLWVKKRFFHLENSLEYRGDLQDDFTYYLTLQEAFFTASKLYNHRRQRVWKKKAEKYGRKLEKANEIMYDLFPEYEKTFNKVILELHNIRNH